MDVSSRQGLGLRKRGNLGRTHKILRFKGLKQL